MEGNTLHADHANILACIMIRKQRGESERTAFEFSLLSHSLRRQDCSCFQSPSVSQVINFEEWESFYSDSTWKQNETYLIAYTSALFSPCTAGHVIKLREGRHATNHPGFAVCATVSACFGCWLLSGSALSVIIRTCCAKIPAFFLSLPLFLALCLGIAANTYDALRAGRAR